MKTSFFSLFIGIFIGFLIGVAVAAVFFLNRQMPATASAANCKTQIVPVVPGAIGTETPVPPTGTPLVPPPTGTVTPVPPTATPVPPTVIPTETPGKQKCNQGVGNGNEGCDPGNSDHNQPSNDEGGGQPGNPGRGGGQDKGKGGDK